MKFIIFYVIFLTGLTLTFADNKPLDKKIIEGNKTETKDTLVHKYNFVVGDTLEYRVASNDSIVVNWESPLIKERYEKIRLVCEKVDKKTGHFFISYEYIQYIGYETKSPYKKSKRDKHPWLNKKVILEIDSLGNRYSYQYSDTTTKGFTAGGPFQGSVLQPLGKSTSIKGQTWIIVDDTTYSPENGYETPENVMTNLFEDKGNVDTLDRQCVRIDLSFTGSSQVFVNSKKALFLMTAGRNGHSEVYISKDLFIPVFVYYTQEMNFNMMLSKDKSTKGKHLSYSYFQLDRFVGGKGRELNKKATKSN